MSEPITAKRRIALFLDGTWNTYEDNTNVWRLKLLCHSDALQLTYYSKGVGTAFGEKVRGGALGYGIDQEVINAYEWLIENYENGDQLFLFGFSRGAYTARSLSGLISKCGLLRRGSPLSVRELYDRYQKDSSVLTIRQLKSAREKGNDKSCTQQERWMLKYCEVPAIWFIGVWDTVGSLGIPLGSVPNMSSKSYQYLETDLRINNTRAFHALAIDEHRNKFAPTFWTKAPNNTRDPRSIEEVEQRWFVGCHSNVGGGYNGDLLAQRPLQWLKAKAEQHGLKFRNGVDVDGDIYSAPIHDSYSDFLLGAYKYFPLSQRYYRPIGVSPIADGPSKGNSTINETIDSSVFERWRQDPNYRPRNLKAWAGRNGVAIESLTSSVRADNPTEVVPDGIPQAVV